MSANVTANRNKVSCTNYRGYTITSAVGTQIGYLTPGRDTEPFRIGKGRKIHGYEITGGHLDSPRWCDTLREAREYIDVARGT